MSWEETDFIRHSGNRESQLSSGNILKDFTIDVLTCRARQTIKGRIVKYGRITDRKVLAFDGFQV